MSASLLKILADFDTQLATAASIGGTTATLVSATDDDGNTLPTGTYGLTIDAGNSSKEYIICTLTSTALTSILSITRQGVTSSGFARTHRRGAKVTVTDWAILSRMLNNLNGTTGFDSAVKLGYDADPSITSSDVTKFATVQFVIDTALASATDATETNKGVTKLSVAAASPTDPIAVGDNDGRVPTQAENDALVGNNTDVAVGTGNKYVTQTGLIHNAETFAVDGSGSSTAYTADLSPVPTSLTDGMTVRVKIVSANTTTTPTLNVNSLGAKTIVKYTNTALAVGDIGTNSYNTFVYDSTNTVWVLQSPIANIVTQINYKTGFTTGTLNIPAGGGTDTITHNLGVLPRFIGISVANTSSVGAGGNSVSYGIATLTGSTINNQQSTASTGSTSYGQASSSTKIAIVWGNGSTSYASLSNVTTTTFDIVWDNSGSTVNGTPIYVWSVQS